jgi:hypothetical protein
MTLALEIDKKHKQVPASDVRIMNSLPLAAAGKILTDGVLIYCRDDKARVDYETIVRCAYFDFLPFIHNYQRTYLEQIVVQSEINDFKCLTNLNLQFLMLASQSATIRK